MNGELPAKILQKLTKNIRDSFFVVIITTISYCKINTFLFGL